MTREFTNGHPQRLQACYFLSHIYFYNIFLQKSRKFSFQILAKFEAAKTGSGVGFLRLTAVCIRPKHTRIALGTQWISLSNFTLILNLFSLHLRS